MRHRQILSLFFGAVALIAGALPAGADIILADNLTTTTGGTETVTGSTLYAASFATDSSAYTLSSVTLLLQRTSIAGQAQLSLFSDGDLEPGSLVATLGSTSGSSSALTETTFVGGDIMLAANSTYWVVLTAVSGSFDWAWSSSNSGTGSGFRVAWSESDDDGGTWFTGDSYPFQSRIVVNAVPEPASIALITMGTPVVLAIARLRTRRRAALGQDA